MPSFAGPAPWSRITQASPARELVATSKHRTTRTGAFFRSTARRDPRPDNPGPPDSRGGRPHMVILCDIGENADHQLLPRGFIHLARHFDAAQPVHILGDAAVERLGDA